MRTGEIITIGSLILFIIVFGGLFIWYGVLNVIAKYYRGDPVTTVEKVLASILGFIFFGSILILLVVSIILIVFKNRALDRCIAERKSAKKPTVSLAYEPLESLDAKIGNKLIEYNSDLSVIPNINIVAPSSIKSPLKYPSSKRINFSEDIPLESLQKRFLDACIEGDIVKARDILYPRGANINYEYDINKIRVGANKIRYGNDFDFGPLTALMTVILGRYNHVFETSEFLIDNGADVTITTGNLNTAIHFATWNLELFKLLTDNGADVEAQNDKGKMPIHIAAINGHFDTVKYLIYNGADFKVVDKQGRDALWYIQRYEGKANKEDVIALISEYSSPDFNIQDNFIIKFD